MGKRHGVDATAATRQQAQPAQQVQHQAPEHMAKTAAQVVSAAWQEAGREA